MGLAVRAVAIFGGRELAGLVSEARFGRIKTEFVFSGVLSVEGGCGDKTNACGGDAGAGGGDRR